eukprot:6183084-Pleurochrysis_carterae.AAC.2
MHADGSDDGLGTIVYLNHKSSSLHAGVGMPHADLILGRFQIVVAWGGGLCASKHSLHIMWLAFADESFGPGAGISQMRLVHYRRGKIAQLTQHFRNNPQVVMLVEGERKAYLLRERHALGAE